MKKRFKTEELPLVLFDRLADCSKLYWWYAETLGRKTIRKSQLDDLFCSFQKQNLVRFTPDERLVLYKWLVLSGNDSAWYRKELIESFKVEE